MRTWFARLALAAVIGSGLAPAAQGSESGFYGGACHLQLRAAYAPALTAMVKPTQITLTTLSGTCVVNETVVTGALSGVLGPLFGMAGNSCEGGVATGRGTFRTGYTGYPILSVAIETVGAGGLVSVTVSNDVQAFRATGTFVQDPIGTGACAAGTPTGELAWTGTLVFEGPAF